MDQRNRSTEPTRPYVVRAARLFIKSASQPAGRGPHGVSTLRAALHCIALRHDASRVT